VTFVDTVTSIRVPQRAVIPRATERLSDYEDADFYEKLDRGAIITLLMSYRSMRPQEQEDKSPEFLKHYNDYQTYVVMLLYLADNN
jgi:hypothetical protein